MRLRTCQSSQIRPWIVLLLDPKRPADHAADASRCTVARRWHGHGSRGNKNSKNFLSHGPLWPTSMAFANLDPNFGQMFMNTKCCKYFISLVNILSRNLRLFLPLLSFLLFSSFSFVLRLRILNGSA